MTKPLYMTLMFIFMTFGSQNCAYAKSYCHDMFDKTSFSRFAIDPATAIVGVFTGEVTAADMVAEINMLQTPGRNPGRINRVEKVFTRKAWDEFNGPISTQVREFFYGDKGFRKFSRGKNFKLRLRIQYFKAGEYADGVNEGGFHIDHFYTLFSKQKTDIYVFNLSTGSENIAPTEFYAGPEIENLEKLIQVGGPTGVVQIPDKILSSFVYSLGNGEFIRMSGETLHRRSVAQRAGYRYFIQIQDAEDYN